MRREVNGSLIWWLALALAVGAIVGWLVLPLFEPHVTTTISIANSPNLRSCWFSLGEEKNLLGRIGYDEGTTIDLRCNEDKVFGNESIHCRCDDERKSRDSQDR